MNSFSAKKIASQYLERLKQLARAGDPEAAAQLRRENTKRGLPYFKLNLKVGALPDLKVEEILRKGARVNVPPYGKLEVINLTKIYIDPKSSRQDPWFEYSIKCFFYFTKPVYVPRTSEISFSGGGNLLSSDEMVFSMRVLYGTPNQSLMDVEMAFLEKIESSVENQLGNSVNRYGDRNLKFVYTGRHRLPF